MTTILTIKKDKKSPIAKMVTGDMNIVEFV